MGCGTALHHWAVLVALAAIGIAVIGGYTLWIWRPTATQRLTDALRDREAETPRGLSNWRGLVLGGAAAAVIFGLVSLVQPAPSVYVLFGATVLPMGAIDLGQTEYCKSVATRKPLDQEVESLNRWARRLAPTLVGVGLLSALGALALAVLTNLC